jgi:Ran GTPase-activating protein 1
MSSDTVYSLEGKNLKLTSREDIEPHIAEINAIQDLQEIHLGGNTLGVGACQALGEALKDKKNLRVSATFISDLLQTMLTLFFIIQIANFADIFTGRLISEIPDALRALCDSLIEHESLVEINLSDNAFGGRSAEPMVNFLTHNHHFSVLKLNNNGLGIQGGKIIATALIEAAEELKKLGLPSKLKTVICGRNRLEDGSAPVWAKAYAAHGNLEEVRMFQNGIRMDGLIAITQGLASCPNLKVLDLQDNTATIRGSRGIAACLPKWNQLEVLNLSDCLLKPKGGYLVIDALGKGANSNLKTLQLQYCDLDRKALERLASVIDGEAIKGLEKLDINGNWADEEDECIEKIKKGLEKHGHADALDELDEM